MDFVGALPKTVKGFDSISVVVDRLTKISAFYSYQDRYDCGEVS